MGGGLPPLTSSMGNDMCLCVCYVCVQLALLARVHRTAPSHPLASAGQGGGQGEQNMWRGFCNLSLDIAEALSNVYGRAKDIYMSLVEANRLLRIVGEGLAQEPVLSPHDIFPVVISMEESVTWAKSVFVAIGRALSEMSNHRLRGVAIAIDACLTLPHQSDLLVALAR